ncbi:UbiH/UbiF/VisC/COQ6 family ubiquinone biosynthesis hydroxylase [Halomonas sp. Mc5H-6]|uniref:UbiH/UbiF/VisC/COQ6 family ubiquinone biosynthesis hydroxylase n=1 Tax=Halomonas sp. Mc5H-6 TaxID=2954500 RepID=UPI00209736DF|nr:UbiH/UbiF/VisC/COQ6 family ubiquinone biosynthesis hydroxylase [Halomonas sp. Mc5H-6]MCO7245786.1 UbiH/UbiF/VisC/COQ6 family ubiquinone biosynthesis hydroxylase [Halomonas sp. Mc5H-6]
MQTSNESGAAAENGFDAIVVGAGMVGSALSWLLADAGMRVALVEAQAQPPSYEVSRLPSLRVSALTPVSQRLLTHIGAWPLMVNARVTPYRYMQVWDAEGSGEIRFSADEAGVSVLGHIVENDVTLSALHAKLQDQGRVSTFFGTPVDALEASTPGRRLSLANGQSLHAPLVVAADGGRSALRDMAGIDVVSEAMGQEAVVTTVRCDHPHGGTARQAFIDGCPLAFLPLTVEGDAHYCSIVWSTTPAHAQALCQLSREALGEALGNALGERMGAVSACDQAHRFALVQRHAVHYVQPHFALVGDAAHSLHPLAGQGANLGLMDAAVLADEVTSAWRRGAPWGELSTLTRYARRRRGDNRAMLALMKGFKTLFGSHDPALTLVRNLGMSGLHQLTPLKRAVMRQATGERGRLPTSCR